MPEGRVPGAGGDGSGRLSLEEQGGWGGLLRGAVGPDAVHVVVRVRGRRVWGRRAVWGQEEAAGGELGDLGAVEDLLHVHVVQRKLALAFGEAHVARCDLVDLGLGAILVGCVDAGAAADADGIPVIAGLLGLGRGFGELGHAGR